MLVLSIGKKSGLGIFLKILVMTLWVVVMATILPSCSDSPGYNYTISGGISGMVGSGMVLRNNLGDDLKINSNGSFSFNTALSNGAAYNIEVTTQPSNPSQNCVVSNGSGSINGSQVSNVAVSCTMSSHPVMIDTSGDFAYMTKSATSQILAGLIDNTSGALTKITGSPYEPDADNPTYITIYPSPTSGEAAGKFVYVTDLASSGTIWCYSIDDPLTGALTPRGSVTAGKYPTAVAVDPAGKFAYTANMGAGTISAYTINSTTGALTALSSNSGNPFTAGTSPIGVTIDPTGKFAYVANMYNGTISAYKIEQTTTATITAGALTAITGSPFAAGTYPTNVTIDLTGKFAYVSNIGSANISAYTIDSTTGALTAVSGSPFTAHSYPNPVTIDPTGKFAYVSNMGYSSISAYTINSTTGVLTEVSGSPFAAGVYPSPVTIDPTGSFAYVSNMGSGTVWAYTINSTTGALSNPLTYTIGTLTYPNTVTIDPSGGFAYVSLGSDSTIIAYKIESTGALTPVTGNPFTLFP
jgi:6-phosphogluconolactonase